MANEKQNMSQVRLNQRVNYSDNVNKTGKQTEGPEGQRGGLTCNISIENAD